MPARLRANVNDEPLPQFSWDQWEADEELESLGQSPDAKDLPSPPTAWLPAKDMKTYGARSLTQECALVRCHDCDKPVLASAIAEHKKNCAQIQLTSGKKGAESVDGDAGKGKKRKADDGPEGEDGAPKKKKSKKEAAKLASAAKGRLKGPIDVDRQCGVTNVKGLPCSRSITCKVHSMALKRAVEGRSKHYDELLLDWKRANIPGFVEPVKRETKAERKEKKDKEREEKKKKALEAAGPLGLKGKKAGGKKTAKDKEKEAAAAQAALDEDGDAELDSDAEFESLLGAVRAMKSTAVPLAKPANVASLYVARNEKLRCCADIVFNALKRPTVGGFGGGGGEDVLMR